MRAMSVTIGEMRDKSAGVTMQGYGKLWALKVRGAMLKQLSYVDTRIHTAQHPV